ncbi:hypothetical protein [Bacillus sp. 1P02SD]
MLLLITVPALTSIAQPVEEMGKKIINLLVEEINNH